jgi:hypothetical protein
VVLVLLVWDLLGRTEEPYEKYQVYRCPTEFRYCYLINKKRTVLPESLSLFDFLLKHIVECNE